MVAAIYSLDKVNGADVMLLGWIICGVIYLLACLLIRENRSRHGLRNVLWFLLVSEIVTDIIWAILYYEDGSYVNYGIGSVYGLLIWPVILLTAGTFVTIQNREK